MPVSGSVDGWRTYRNYDPNIHCPASRRDAQIKQRIKAQQRVVNAKLKYQKPFSTRIQEDVKFLNKRAFEKAKTDITREVNRNYSYFLGTQYATSRFKNYVSANISDNIRPAAAKKGDPNSKNYGNHHHHHHHGHSHDSHGHDGDGHTLDSEKSTTSRLNRLYISRPLKKHNRSFLNPQAQTDRQRRLQDWQTKERKRREKLKLHMKKLRKSLQNSQHEHEQYQGYRDGIPLEHALDDIKHFLDFPHAVPRDRGDDHGSSAAASKHDDTDTRGKHSRESDDIGHAVVSGGGKTPPTRPNPDQHYNKLVYKYRGSLDVRTRDHWKHEVRQPVSSTYYNASEEAQPVMDKLAFHPREARLFRNMWTPSTLLTSQHFEQA